MNTYAVPISVKGIVFDTDNKVWLRKNERDEWELPGGKIDEGEQPEQTLARELREELSFTVKVNDIISAYMYTIHTSADESRGVLVLIYKCELIESKGIFEFEGEAGAAAFQAFSLSELLALNMPDFYKQAIQNAVKL